MTKSDHMDLPLNTPIDIAFSPCPNDTFIFYAWVHGIVGKQHPCQPHLHDIQTLNEKKFPVTKASLTTAFNKGKDYSILPVGAALGFGCGPLVIGRKPLKKVAIPGIGTVANLLFDLFVPACEKVYTTYDKIFSLIEEGVVDGGVIIHESRFIYPSRGHSLLYDLGALWEKETALPLPLGVLMIKKDLNSKSISQVIQESIRYGFENRSRTFPYTQEMSQEKEPSIINQHIDLYVNQESIQMTSLGKLAIKTLFDKASKKGLLHEQAALSFCDLA